MPTLLEQAKAVELNRTGTLDITNEHIELALAWLIGEISTRQCQSALSGKRDYKSVNRLYTIALALRKAYELGRVQVVEKK